MHKLGEIGGNARPWFIPIVSRFVSPEDGLKQRNFQITGITKDSGGVALVECTVNVYAVGSPNYWVGSAISDGTGVYAITVNEPGAGVQFFAVAYKAGSPDVAGTTVNTLQGVEL